MDSGIVMAGEKYLRKIVDKKVGDVLESDVKWYGRPASRIPGASYADMIESRSGDLTDAVYNLAGKGRGRAERNIKKSLKRLRSGKLVAYGVEDPEIPASETIRSESYGEDVDEYAILGEHRQVGWNKPPQTFLSRLFNTEPDTVYVAMGRPTGQVRQSMAHEFIHDTGVSHDTYRSSQVRYDKELEGFQYGSDDAGNFYRPFSWSEEEGMVYSKNRPNPEPDWGTTKKPMGTLEGSPKETQWDHWSNE